jgi:RimJ/RimL family protein N-acetyltransferase
LRDKAQDRILLSPGVDNEPAIDKCFVALAVWSETACSSLYPQTKRAVEMTMTSEKVSKRNYPWTAKVKDNEITIRLMTPEDGEELLAFARSLPERDLLFLSIDITRPEVIEGWMRHIGAGRSFTVMAEVEGKLIGHATLYLSELTWTRHMGEIQLLISTEYRGGGLGTLLANEVFAIAQDLGLQKIIARMAADQRGALQVFERLGFKAEALLADFVIDRDGRTHDLIVMSHDITGLTV